MKSLVVLGFLDVFKWFLFYSIQTLFFLKILDFISHGCLSFLLELGVMFPS